MTVKGHSRMGYGKHLSEKLNVTYAVTAATGLLDAEEFKSFYLRGVARKLLFFVFFVNGENASTI